MKLEIYHTLKDQKLKWGYVTLKGKHVVRFTEYGDSGLHDFLAEFNSSLRLDTRQEYVYHIFDAYDKHKRNTAISFDKNTFLCSPNIFQKEYLRYYNSDRLIYSQKFKMAFICSLCGLMPMLLSEVIELVIHMLPA